MPLKREQGRSGFASLESGVADRERGCTECGDAANDSPEPFVEHHPIRDPKTDALLTPENAMLALIDYQPEQYAGVASVGHDELLAHVSMHGRVATAFELPVVLSTYM